jgi:hypothetical protein
MWAHYVSPTCVGEICGYETHDMGNDSLGSHRAIICARPATHKIGEEIADDEPLPGDLKPLAGVVTAGNFRHNLTTYVCCEHFGRLFGQVAHDVCGGKYGEHKNSNR